MVINKASPCVQETKSGMKVVTMRMQFFLLLVLTLVLAGIAPAVAQPMQPGGGEQFIPPKSPPSTDIPGGERGEGRSPRFRRRPRGGGGPEAREEQRRRLERAREMAQRLLDNPSTSGEIKAKARQLTDLLGKREGLARDLDGKRQSFLQEHGQDIDELRQLRERKSSPTICPPFKKCAAQPKKRAMSLTNSVSTTGNAGVARNKRHLRVRNESALYQSPPLNAEQQCL